jgi:hypothetical protein
MSKDEDVVLSFGPEHSREDLIWKLIKAGCMIVDRDAELVRLKAELAKLTPEYRVVIPRNNKPIIHSYTDPDKARRAHEVFSRIARHWPGGDGEVRFESRLVTPWAKCEEAIGSTPGIASTVPLDSPQSQASKAAALRALHRNSRSHHRVECQCQFCCTDGVEACSEKRPCQTCCEAEDRAEEGGSDAGSQ